MPKSHNLKNNAPSDSIQTMLQDLDKISPKIGKFGGRHFFNDKETKKYVTYSQIVRRYVKLAAQNFEGKQDKEAFIALKERIESMNEAGNKALQTASRVQKFFTSIKSRFMKIFFNREKAIAKALSTYEKAENAFVEKISNEVIKAFTEKKNVVERIVQIVENMESELVYDKIYAKIEEQNPAALHLLPLPNFIKARKLVEILTRTLPLEKEKELFSTTDMILLAEGWKEHLSSNEQLQPLLSALIGSLKKPLTEEEFNRSSERPLCRLAENKLLVKLPTHEIMEISLDHKDITSRRVINRFVKHVLGEEYNQSKLLLETKTLSAFRQSNDNWSHQPALRNWVKEVLIHLETKNLELASPLEEVKAEIKVCQEEIRAQEAIKQEASLVSTSFADLQSTSPQNVVVDFSHIDPHVSLSPFSQSHISSASTAPIKTLEAINFSSPDALQKTEAWAAHIQELLHLEHFEAADRAAMMYLDQLKNPATTKSLLQNVPQGKISEWTAQFSIISEAMISSTFALSRPCVPHTRIAALLRAFALMQNLLLKDPSAKFTGFSFSTNWLKVGLKDPYLDLGSSGGEILRIIQELSDIKGDVNDFSGSEYARYLQKVPNPPQSFLDTQHAYRLLGLALTPTYRLTEKSSSSEKNVSRKEYLEDQKKVRQKLSSSAGPIKFETSGNSSYLTLTPYDLKFYTDIRFLYRNIYESTTSGVMTSFSNQTHPIKKREVRTRLIEGVMAQHDCGRGEKGTNADYNDFRYDGAVQTQQNVQDENLEKSLFGNYSPELCKKLQLMQTAPQDRVRNTLHLFAENLSLFNDPDMQRLFSLNLFRSGFLYEKISADPLFLDDLTAHLGYISQAALLQEIPLGYFTHTLSCIIEIARSALPEKDLTALIHLQNQLLEKLDTSMTETEALIQSGQSGTTLAYQDSCQKWLLAMSERAFHTFSEEEKTTFAKRALLFFQFPRKSYNEDAFATICDCYDQMLSSWAPSLDDLRTKLQAILSLRIKEFNAETWEPLANSSNLTWSNGDQTIHLPTGALYQKRSTMLCLPLAVKKKISSFIQEEDLRKEHAFTVHRIQNKTYRQIQLTAHRGNQHFGMKVFIADSGASSILMELEAGKWFQLQDTPLTMIGKQWLPRELAHYGCWTHQADKSMKFLDDKGELKASATWSAAEKAMDHLILYKSGTAYPLLFSKNKTQMEIFERLELANGVFFSGENQEVSDIIYPDLALSYKKAPSLNGWICSLYPQYLLSSKTLGALLTPLSQENSAAQAQVFARSFKDYHLLEDPKGIDSPVLLLSGREYQRYRDPQEISLRKHGQQKYAKAPVASDPPMLFSYKVDPERGLVAREPEGYLYLAYTLWTQGKYPQAALAMRQGFNRLQGLTPQAIEVVSYFKKWESKDPNGHALLTKLFLYEIEQQQNEQTAEEITLTREKELYAALMEYKKYLTIEKDIDPQLHLSQEEKDKFTFLARRSKTWVYQELKAQAPQIELWSEIFKMGAVPKSMRTRPNLRIKRVFKVRINRHIKHLQQDLKNAKPDDAAGIQEMISKYQALQSNIDEALKQIYEGVKSALIDFKDLQFYAEKSLLHNRELDLNVPDGKEKADALLKWGLDREIEIRTSLLPPPTPLPDSGKILLDQGIALFPQGEAYLVAEQVSLQEKEKILRYIEELKTVFRDKDSYEAEMAQEIAQDVKDYCALIGLPLEAEQEGAQKVYTGFNLDKLASLNQELLQKQVILKAQKKTLQSSIIFLFQLGDTKNPLLRALKEQDPVTIDLFREGRFCFGSEDFSSLVKKGIIKEDDIQQITALYKEYLLSSTELQQVESLLGELTKKEISHSKIIDLLRTERNYALTHKLAPALLLLEEELGVICKKNQVQHFAEMVTHKSSFKHEAWAGGKTYILRHLITKFHANGGFASSLLTHAPLIEEHHKSLKESTAAFYGQQAYCTEFSRATPTDGLTMRREHLKLIKVVQEKGRTDQTMHAFISARHAHNLAITRLSPDSTEQDLDAAFAFNNYLRFRQERIILGSDEIDQLTTPDQEYNYASGAPLQLSAEITAPAMEIGQFLAGNGQQFAAYFAQEGKNPGEMSEKEREEFHQMLSQHFFTLYNPQDISLEDFQLYCSPVAEDITEQDFKKLQAIHEKIKASPSAPKLHSVSIYLSQILPLVYRTKLGVHYGRSANGVETKPYNLY
jgi:hypothetical protein